MTIFAVGRCYRRSSGSIGDPEAIQMAEVGRCAGVPFSRLAVIRYSGPIKCGGRVCAFCAAALYAFALRQSAILHRQVKADGRTRLPLPNPEWDSLAAV